MPHSISLTHPSLQIFGKNIRFPDFWSLTKVNCHNLRARDDIKMKLGPVTILYKRNKTRSKNIDDGAISINCDVIVIFPVYGRIGAIRKRDSGCIVYKTYIFINCNLLSYKN